MFSYDNWLEEKIVQDFRRLTKWSDGYPDVTLKVPG